MIVLDSKKQLTVDIISKVNDGRISTIHAQKLLGISKRTIERYLKKFRKEGVVFIVHKNSNKEPKNKISLKIKHTVHKLIKQKYFDLNLTHLREKLELDENIAIVFSFIKEIKRFLFSINNSTGILSYLITIIETY